MTHAELTILALDNGARSQAQAVERCARRMTEAQATPAEQRRILAAMQSQLKAMRATYLNRTV